MRIAQFSSLWSNFILYLIFIERSLTNVVRESAPKKGVTQQSQGHESQKINTKARNTIGPPAKKSKRSFANPKIVPM